MNVTVQDAAITAILLMLLILGYSYLAYDATHESEKGVRNG